MPGRCHIKIKVGRLQFNGLQKTKQHFFSGLQEMTAKRIFYFTVLFGLFIAAVDLLADYFFFYNCSTFGDSLINVPGAELFMRGLIFLSFVVFGLVAAKMVSKVQASQMHAQSTLDFQQQLLNAIPAPVFYKASDGRYTGCNTAFEDFLGMKKEKIIGKTVYELAPAEIARVYDEKDQELFHAPGKQIYEFVVERKGGDHKNVIFHKATFTGKRGQVAGLIGAILDITERRKVEIEKEELIEKLKKALDEVEVLSGFLPICSSCKKVRDDSGYWNQIESYIQKHSTTRFSHSLCPHCEHELYGQEPWYRKKRE